MGLGDTNYDQFCHMGKIIDKRLMELGGNRFHPLCCADEATGLEETVERWKEEIMDLLCQLDELIAVAAAKAFNPHELVQSFETLAVVNQPSWIPSGLMDMSCLINWLNVPMLVQLNPESSQLPNAKNVLSNGPFVTVSASVSVTSVSTTISVDGWTAANPFLASIKSARWLTSTANINEDEVCWGETKRVLHLELDLSCSGIEYLPGDSIGICCPNPRSLIDAILLRLKDAHQELNLDLDTRVAITSNGIEECITLQEILSYK